MSSLCIRNGRIVDPANKLDALRDVLVRDGVIAGVELPGAFDGVEVTEIIDATGCIVAPGLIDIHVHLREPGQTYKENIQTGTTAAAAGGFTTVVAMPNTLPISDSLQTLNWMLSPARKPRVRVFAMPAATKGSLGKVLTDFAALAEVGALGFTDDGKPILDVSMMRAALVRAAQLGLFISQHAEDPGLSQGAIMNAGPVAFRLGLRGYPATAESSIVERDIALVRDIAAVEGLNAHLHVQHCSTAGAVAAVRAAKLEGLHITCEVAPHHFTLTDEAVAAGGVHREIPYDTNAKMNPPLRSEADREALIAGLLDGTIDCIATDHAPHARYEKEVEFERAPNGITGLETSLGLTLKVLHQTHGASLSQVVDWMSAAPSRVTKLGNAGSLSMGKWADVVVFDPRVEWVFHAAASKSRSKNTPFDGTTMLGRVKATVVAGRVVYRAPA